MNEKIKKELKRIEMNPIKRFFNCTPKYFKIVMSFGVGLVGLAFTIKEMPVEMRSYFPHEVISYANYIIAVGGSIVFISGQTINKEAVVAKLKKKYEVKADED